MAEHSAGILVYRVRNEQIEVMLVHPGGPFWAGKDAGAWSIPKGLFTSEEEPLAAAKREFQEETGFAIEGDFLPLGAVKQPSGKTVHVWAVPGDVDVENLISNSFEMEWPPRSGKKREFPEVDKGEWFSLSAASEKILKGQREFLARLAEVLGLDPAPPPPPE